MVLSQQCKRNRDRDDGNFPYHRLVFGKEDSLFQGKRWHISHGYFLLPFHFYPHAGGNKIQLLPFPQELCFKPVPFQRFPHHPFHNLWYVFGCSCSSQRLEGGQVEQE